MNVHEDNSLSIGRTPLVRINRVIDGNIFAKIEGRNPAFSVKCRIGASMIWDAEERGVLKAGMSIVEPTSGNTGIALAFVAASRGYPITLVMPDTMSMERRKVLLAFGAKLELTEGAKGMKAAIARAQEICATDPQTWWMPSQFDNPANPAIHEKTTGPEIWDDLDGNVDVVVCGVGTGGTLTGIGRYPKGRGRDVTMVAVEPESSPVIGQTMAGEEPTPSPHKIQGIGAGFVPGNLDLSLVGRVERVSNEDAVAMARALATREGILCGISCGAAAVAAKRVAEDPGFAGKNIVVILPDSGERYLSSILYDGVFESA